MVLGIQVAGFLFGLFMIYYSFLNFKKKEFSKKEFGVWLVAWILFIIIALFPQILDPLVQTLDFARTFDLLMISGFLFMLLVVFHTHTIARKTQRQVERVVRSMAIIKSKKK
jgi:hypothetical protein